VMLKLKPKRNTVLGEKVNINVQAKKKTVTEN
jgi:hypothetical protein